MATTRRPYPRASARAAAWAGFSLLGAVLVAALLSPRPFPAVPAALTLGGAGWFLVREVPRSFHIRRAGDFDDEDGDWPAPVPLAVPEPEPVDLPDPWADLAPTLLDPEPEPGNA